MVNAKSIAVAPDAGVSCRPWLAGRRCRSSSSASALVARGGSSSSLIAPDGYAPEPAAAIELDLTEDRIAATEIGAVGLAFDLEEGQRQAIRSPEAVRARLALVRADMRA